MNLCTQIHGPVFVLWTCIDVYGEKYVCGHKPCWTVFVFYLHIGKKKIIIDIRKYIFHECMYPANLSLHRKYCYTGTRMPVFLIPTNIEPIA